MFTHKYKGYWIHGRCDTDIVKVQRPDGTMLGDFKSYLAGQQAITKHINKLKMPLIAA